MSNSEYSIQRGMMSYMRIVHGTFFNMSLTIWIIGLWVVCLFSNPGFIIAFGVLYGAVAGSRLGGLEVGDRSAEFAFATPPTRQQRYFLSLKLGLSSVLGFTVIGTLAIAYNVPQMLWSLIVTSGFTEPYVPTETIVYIYAVLIPTAVFATSFAIANIARTPAIATGANVIGVASVGAVIGLSYFLEMQIFGAQRSVIAPYALVIMSILVLIFGYKMYLKKDMIILPTSGASKWIWVVVVVLVVLLFIMFNFIAFKAVSHEDIYERRPIQLQSVEVSEPEAAATE